MRHLGTLGGSIFTGPPSCGGSYRQLGWHPAQYEMAGRPRMPAGLGAIGAPGRAGLFSVINAKLTAFDLGVLLTDSPKFTWNALDAILGRSWWPLPDQRDVRAALNAAAAKFMHDVPHPNDVHHVQVKLNVLAYALNEDGLLGERTWNAIDRAFAAVGASGFQWWKLPFTDVAGLIVNDEVASVIRQVTPPPTTPTVTLTPMVIQTPTLVTVEGARAAPPPGFSDSTRTIWFLRNAAGLLVIIKERVSILPAQRIGSRWRVTGESRSTPTGAKYILANRRVLLADAPPREIALPPGPAPAPAPGPAPAPVPDVIYDYKPPGGETEVIVQPTGMPKWLLPVGAAMVVGAILLAKSSKGAPIANPRRRRRRRRSRR